MPVPSCPQSRAARRRLLGGAAAGLALVLTGLPAQAAARSRARYRLAGDFGVPANTFGLVPWTVTVFQTGSDVTLQPDGKVLISASGLYELVFCADWDAKSGNDIDLRKIGIRRQALGQPDEPMEAHERLGFIDLPGSDPPAMARYQGAWAPPALGPGQFASTDVSVAPAGLVAPGDTVVASHTSISSARLGDEALTALIVHAKVIAADTVRVTLYNPGVAAGIAVPAGTLRVVAMSSVRTRGSNGDAWMLLHTASTRLDTGDRVYGLIEHKVDGTLLQATKSSYLQIDRIG
ncbi:hypothetical protein [Ideonella sp.]|uniref:hypothetical protein n=1 Tax=Ideonella sp. TaxID=1929293 RepID=UPI002B45EAF4|nr:hypothetical protein [Ideonella sp.]HJV68120.1 hypothetical protein [Ideonella sp.]